MGKHESSWAWAGESPHRRVEKHGRQACTFQTTVAAAGGIGTKTVWKVDFRVIQAIPKQKKTNHFYSF